MDLSGIIQPEKQKKMEKKISKFLEKKQKHFSHDKGGFVCESSVKKAATLLYSAFPCHAPLTIIVHTLEN